MFTKFVLINKLVKSIHFKSFRSYGLCDFFYERKSETAHLVTIFVCVGRLQFGCAHFSFPLFPKRWLLRERCF